MGQYSPGTPSGAITATFLDTELSAIETAHNTHATADFPDACVPNTALVNPMAYYTMHLYTESVGASVVETTIQDSVIVPCNSTLVSAKCICTARAAGNEETTLYREADTDVELLSSGTNITLAAAMTVYTATLAETAFYTNDVLTLRCVTGVGESITGLRWTLTFKANHVS